MKMERNQVFRVLFLCIFYFWNSVGWAVSGPEVHGNVPVLGCVYMLKVTIHFVMAIYVSIGMYQGDSHKTDFMKFYV